MHSPMEDTNKSIKEHKLREENMVLRQEILKLKKALYMSNESTQEICHTKQLNLPDYSPMYSYSGLIHGTPTDSE